MQLPILEKCQCKHRYNGGTAKSGIIPKTPKLKPIAK
jgi:hypothetical protein